MMYSSWDIECDRHIFLSFWTIFGSFTPLTTQDIKILKTFKKTPGDIMILHMCTINYNHVMYGSWDTKHDKMNSCHFGQYFAHLPPKNPKNQNFEKMKKSLEILSFYTSVPKFRIYYTVPEIWHLTDVTVIFHFGLFFALLPPKQPKKWKFWKNGKNTTRYHHFTHVY